MSWEPSQQKYNSPQSKRNSRDPLNNSPEPTPRDPNRSPPPRPGQQPYYDFESLFDIYINRNFNYIINKDYQININIPNNYTYPSEELNSEPMIIDEDRKRPRSASPLPTTQKNRKIN